MSFGEQDPDWEAVLSTWCTKEGSKINAEFSYCSSSCHPHWAETPTQSQIWCSHRNEVPQPSIEPVPPSALSSAWWCHPALAEQSITRNTHTQNVHSAKTPNTQTQTSPRPGPHGTNKTQDAALCSLSFSTVPPHGITHHRGKSSSRSQWHNIPKQYKRLSTADPPGAHPGNTGPFPPTLAVPQHGAWPLRKEYKVLMDNPMLPSSTSYTLHLVEDLSQQPTNAKDLAEKTWVLFIDLEYARQHHQNKTKKEIIPNLCCQEKQGSQRLPLNCFFKKSFRAKQPPSVHLPCIAQSDALVRHKSLSQNDGLGSGISKFT